MRCIIKNAHDNIQASLKVSGNSLIHTTATRFVHHLSDYDMACAEVVRNELWFSYSRGVRKPNFGHC
ncbi:Uncharacterized protein HZ326_26431, partial [Fusarium oxysporum f. sp. albedinis]